MKKTDNIKYPFFIIISSIIVCIFLLQIIKKDTKFSDWENRYLEQKPELTMDSFLDSSFGKNYETYVNEQFPFRKQWIQGKAGIEQAIGKLENNGIVKGKHGYLFTKQLSVGKQLDKNINSIISFANKQKTKVFVGIIPNSYGVLSEQLPMGMPNINQKKWIEKYNNKLKKNKNIHLLSMEETLENHSREPIFYHTDHHWTTLGAYYGYQEICEAFKTDSVSLKRLKSSIVPDFYGTYDAKYKGFGIKPDTITYYHIPVKSITVNGKKKNSLYDMEKIKTRDKYAMFLHGNNGLTRIQSKNTKKENKKKLLIVKDSFSNSLIPFLTFQFDEIYVVDLRYFTENISHLLDEKNIDNTIILYNFDTLVTDNHFYRLK